MALSWTQYPCREISLIHPVCSHYGQHYQQTDNAWLWSNNTPTTYKIGEIADLGFAA